MLCRKGNPGDRKQSHKAINLSSSVAIALNWAQQEGWHFEDVKKPLRNQVLVLNPFLSCQNWEEITSNKANFTSPCGTWQILRFAPRSVPALAHPESGNGKIPKRAFPRKFGQVYPDSPWLEVAFSSGQGLSLALV